MTAVLYTLAAVVLALVVITTTALHRAEARTHWHILADHALTELRLLSVTHRDGLALPSGVSWRCRCGIRWRLDDDIWTRLAPKGRP